MGQIGRTYNQDSKTAKFASVLMMRQFGVVLGPLCILFLDKLAFTLTLGSWTIEVTQYSSSGVLLGKFWFFGDISISRENSNGTYGHENLLRF